MKYSKKTIQSKGFGKRSQANERKKKEIISDYILGYTEWIPFGAIDFDSFSLFHKWQVEGREVFECLGSDLVAAKALLVNGPWAADELGPTLKEFDSVAWDFDRGRRDFPATASPEMLEWLLDAGLEAYHGALCDRNQESVEAVEALTVVFEALGGDLVDTGAYYDEEGNQDGPRDAVYEFSDGTELAFKVFHDPRKAECKQGLPDEVASAVRQWELAT